VVRVFVLIFIVLIPKYVHVGTHLHCFGLEAVTSFQILISEFLHVQRLYVNPNWFLLQTIL
jgi:hypothetical protein